MDLSSENKFVTSREASQLTGYVSDYITRQCRAGKIESKQVGRVWLIDKESLLSHFEFENARKIENAKELARERELEYAQAKKDREARQAPTSPIASPYAPIPAHPSWLVEEVPVRHVRGSFAALAATLALISGGMYIGHAEVRHDAFAFVERVGEHAIAAASTFTRNAVAMYESGARVARDTTPRAILPQVAAPILSIPEFDITESVAVSEIDLKKAATVSEPVEAIDLSPVLNPVASFGATIQNTSHAILAGYHRGLDIWVHTTPEIPETVARSVRDVGFALASGSNAAPQEAIAYVASLEGEMLGVVGNIALVYDTTKETLARAYNYAPQAKLAAVHAIEREVRSAPEIVGFESDIPSKAFPTDTYIYGAAVASESGLLAAFEGIALFTFHAVNQAFEDTADTFVALFASKETKVAVTPPELPKEEPSQTILRKEETAGVPVVVTASPVPLYTEGDIYNEYYTITTTGVSKEYVEERIKLHIDNLDDRIDNRLDDVREGSGGGGGGSGSVTSIDISGGTTGLSFAGGPITSSGSFTMSGTLGIGNGGTGIATLPTYGQMLVGNSSGGYDLVATSSLGIVGGGGSGFSTTSADFWETQQGARTGDDLTNDSIENLLDVASMTKNFGDLLYWNGVAWADIATSSLGLQPLISGDQGQLAYFSGANQVSGTSTLFLSSAGNVGVGQPAPQAKLDVEGSVIIGDGDNSNGGWPLYISSANNLGWKVADSAGTAKFELYAGFGGTNEMRLFDGVSLVGYDQDLTLGVNGAGASLTIGNATGNVGIGTTSSSSRLGVQGNVLISGNLLLANLTATGTASVANLTIDTLNGPLQANNGVVSATSSIGVLYGGTGLTTAPAYGQLLLGNSSGGYTLSATSSLGLQTQLVGTQGQVAYFSGTNQAVGTSSIFIASNGRVGVGTTTPDMSLTIASSTLYRLGLSDEGLFFSRTSDNSYTGSITAPGALNSARQTLRIENREGVQLSYNTQGRLQVQNAGTIIGVGGFNANIGTAVAPLHVVGTSYLNGNVGVGTSSPTAALEVGTSAGGAFFSRIYNNADRVAAFGYGSDERIQLSLNAASTFGAAYSANAGESGIRLGLSGWGYSYIVGGTNLLLNPVTGNVGIGTTSPYAKASIHANNGGTNTTLFAIGSSTASATSTLFTVLNNGNVGIGTTTMYGSALTVIQPNTTPGIYIKNAADASGMRSAFLALDSANLSSDAAVRFYQGGVSQWQIGQLGSSVGATGALHFYQSGSANVLRMTVDSNGNVGIGTTSPYAKLSVAGTIVGANFVGTTTATSTFGGGINIASGCYAAGGTCLNAASVGITGTQGQVAYFSGTNTAVGTSSIRISPEGYVSIGTSTNSAFLSVESSFDAPALDVYASQISGQPAFSIRGPLSTNPTDGKGITLQVIGEDYARSVFYTDGSFGMGSGNATRDVFLSRSTGNTFRISSDRGNGSANLIVNGSVGIGTTSPFAKTSIHANNGETNTTLFAIGSSTASATSTLLSFSNGGNLTVTPTSGAALTVVGAGATQRLNITPETSNRIAIDAPAGIDMRVSGRWIDFEYNSDLSDSFQTAFGFGQQTTNVELTGSSVNQSVVAIGGEFLQTGTASADGLLVAPTFSSLGTGAAGGTGNNIFRAANGTDTKFVITTNGLVGIGTTSPFAKTSIHANNGETNTTLFAIGSSTASATSTHFVVHNSGRVGIGTANPSVSLEVVGGGLMTGGLDVNGNIGSGGRFQSSGAGSASAPIFGFIYGGGTGFYTDVTTYQTLSFTTGGTERMRIAANGNISVGTTTATVDGNGTSFNRFLVSGEPGGVGAAGLVAVGGNITGTADPVGTFVFANQSLSTTEKRIALITGNTDGATNSGNIRFQTSAAGTITEKMRITSAGNVGIGTTTPAKKLHVYDTSVSNGSINELAVIDPGTMNLAVAGSGATIAFKYLTSAYAGAIGGYGNGSLAGMGIWAGTGSGAPQLYVTSAGNVGIGTTTPSSSFKLTSTGAGIFTNHIANNSGVYMTAGNGGYGLIQGTDANNASTKNLVFQEFGGNVGIGTTSPGFKLGVVGSAWFGGTVTAYRASSFDSNGILTLRYGDAGGPQPVLNLDNGSIGVIGDGSAMTFRIGSGNTMSPTNAARISGVSENTTFSGSTADGALVFSTALNDSLNEHMRITSSGLVGIGTSSPYAKFSLSGAATGYAPEAAFKSSDGGIVIDLQGASAAQPWKIIQQNAGTDDFAITEGSTSRLGIASGGTVSISSLISCSGIQTNGSGAMSCTSDERQKNVQEDFTRGLAEIRELTPVVYEWKESSPLFDGGIEYVGFLAQDVERVIPEAVNIGSQGQLQLQQFTLVTTAINAIKELDINIESLASTTPDEVEEGSFVDRFYQNLFAWFADAANGIGDFVANRIRTTELCVKDDTGETCLTRAQLDALLAGVGASDDDAEEDTGGGGSEEPPIEEPPVEEPPVETPPEEEPPIDSGTESGGEEEAGAADEGSNEGGSDAGESGGGDSGGGETAGGGDSGGEVSG